MSWDTLKVPFLTQWKSWWIEHHPSEIGEYSWTYLFERGKQLRPKLFCELWSYLCPDRTPCIELAFIIECIHVTTLILDDFPWMDNAEERRGWKTLHSQFTEKKALLLAHDVIYMAYLIFTSHPLEYYSKTLTLSDLEVFIRQKIYRLWKGQLMDLRGSGSLLDIASMKTGVLFEWVTETVALCLDLDPVFWREWGNRFGILFQWVDDWNDLEEDAKSGQRNAFNENPSGTLAIYSKLWKEIESNIGPSWFERPFGIQLRSYFTDTIPLSYEIVQSTSNTSNISTMSSLLEQSRVSMPYKDAPLERNKQYSKGIFWMRQIQPYLLNSTFQMGEDFFIKTSLWTIPETEWRNHPELQKRMKESPWLFTIWNWLEKQLDDMEEWELNQAKLNPTITL